MFALFYTFFSIWKSKIQTFHRIKDLLAWVKSNFECWLEKADEWIDGCQWTEKVTCLLYMTLLRQTMCSNPLTTIAVDVIPSVNQHPSHWVTNLAALTLLFWWPVVYQIQPQATICSQSWPNITRPNLLSRSRWPGGLIWNVMKKW